MGYGLKSSLPEQDQELVHRLALRWIRAAGPHNEWAEIAKECTNFLEGRQWTLEQIAQMREIKRTALTINKIAPLFRLVMGYQSSNRMDITYLPTSDGASSEEVADLLKMIQKSEAGRIDLKFTDSEVFGDGITTGRGFWDARLCFEENDFGEVGVGCSDPFSTYIDPDCSHCDLNDYQNGAAYIQDSVWTDLDNIETLYGPEAAEQVEYQMSHNHASSLLHFLGEQDISPRRYFGNYADDKAYANWSDVYHMDFVDNQAKRFRLLDSQYYITRIMPCFVDLETGDKEAIPDDWMEDKNQWKIQKAMDYAENRGNPLKIVRRPVRRVRWTVTCGDVVIHDGWSPYKTYTKIPYYPYFRRGTTIGMVQDLRDPQTEMNKKRSVLVDILNRNANSGWIYEENSLDPEQEENLRMYGATPGINIKWKRKENGERPQRIEAGGYPQGLDRLEEKAREDLNQISGINESALGQLDTVQSGRAIEARQRQAVLSIQLYQDNFARSKKIQGRKFLEIFQQHYTEPRIYRIMGEDSSMAIYEINKKQQTGSNSVTRLNDITVGKYSVDVDEVPISATFKQGQFEETMMLLEKLGPIGMALVQSNPELIIDQTSLPRKEEWKQSLMQATSQQALMAGQQASPAAQGGMPIGSAAATPEGFAS